MEAETAFESLVTSLGIPESEWSEHPDVRSFVRQNYRSRYVPPSLLVSMGIQEEAHMSRDRQREQQTEKRTCDRERKQNYAWRKTMRNYFIPKGAA